MDILNEPEDSHFANFVALSSSAPKPIPPGNNADINIPSDFNEAITSPESDHWKAAMDEEIASLDRNGVYELVELPAARKAVGGRWVYALKRNQDGTVAKFKARWVAKGYSQRKGVDFYETYAPVTKLATLRTFLTIAAQDDLDLFQGDFKTAFLTASLVETVYMDQPTGYEQQGSGQRKLVAHLLKAIYGLKQASTAFYDRASTFFATLGLHPTEADSCLFVGSINGRRLMLILYVDDFIIAGSKEDVTAIMTAIKSEFTIDGRGNLDSGMILGIQVKRDRALRTITITQQRYITDVLERFDMVNAKPARTPMDEHKQLIINNETHSKDDIRSVDQTQYLQAVGSLMYLMVSTRPDLSYSVGVVARHNADPRAIHWAAIKRILRYLVGTKDYGITLGGRTDSPLVEAWTDADYAGDHDTRRSTTGFVINVHGSPIIWSSRRQRSITRSSHESEYIALSQGCQNLLWVLKLLRQVHYNTSTVTVHVDNQGTIETTRNGNHSERTKHIDIAYKYGRELVKEGIIDLQYCPTNNMTADILTKALGFEKFEWFRNSIGLIKTQPQGTAHLVEWEC